MVSIGNRARAHKNKKLAHPDCPIPTTEETGGVHHDVNSCGWFVLYLVNISVSFQQFDSNNKHKKNSVVLADTTYCPGNSVSRAIELQEWGPGFLFLGRSVSVTEMRGHRPHQWVVSFIKKSRI